MNEKIMKTKNLFTKFQMISVNLCSQVMHYLTCIGTALQTSVKSFLMVRLSVKIAFISQRALFHTFFKPQK